MANYNLTNFTTSTSFFDTARTINNLAEFWLFSMLLIVIWIILFIAFKGFATKTALLNSSWIVSVIAGLFYAAGLVSATILTIPIIFTGFMVFAHIFGEN